jgi:hypothetical protein
MQPSATGTTLLLSIEQRIGINTYSGYALANSGLVRPIAETNENGTDCRRLPNDF